MSVNLIRDWQLLTDGDKPSNNSLFNIASFYGVDAANSFDLIGDIALSLGYDINDPNFFGMPYMQFISMKIAGEQITGGSYLNTIVNYLS
jgi:hypothetical protein